MIWGNGKLAPIGGKNVLTQVNVIGSGAPPARSTGDFLTQAAADVRYASIGHTHSISQVIGLQDALDGKLSSSGVLSAAHGGTGIQPTTIPGNLRWDGTVYTIDTIAYASTASVSIAANNVAVGTGYGIAGTSAVTWDGAAFAISGKLSTTDNIQIGKGHSDTAEVGSSIQWRGSVGGSVGWAMQLGAGYTLDYWTKAGSSWNMVARMQPGGMEIYSGGTSDTVLGSAYLRLTSGPSSPSVGWTLQIGTVGDLAFWGYVSATSSWSRVAQIFKTGDVTFTGLITGASLSIGGNATVNDLFLPAHVNFGAPNGALLFIDGSSGGKVRAMDGTESGGGAVYCDVGGIHFEAQINIAASVAPNYGAGMHFEPSIDPASPSSGDLWFDGTNVKMCIGSTTKTFVMA